LEEIFLGVDIGTGGVRAIAFTPNLKKIAFSYREHKTISTREDQAEQDPEEIFSNLILCLKEVSRPHRKIAGIGFSSMLHSIMGVDKRGKPVTPLYPFSDNQGKLKVKKIKEKVPDFYQRTGCPPHPMYPTFKILWLKEDRPEVFHKIEKFLSIKSYILYRLTGYLIEDACVASASGLFNIHTLSWDDEILSFLYLTRKNLPTLIEGSEKIHFSHVSGLEFLNQVPIYPGAGDGMLSHLATCGLKEGYLSSTVGTSGALRIATPRPLLDEKGRVWCYYFHKNWWVGGGALHNGGLTLRWFRDKLCREEVEEAKRKGMDIYEIFDKKAQNAPPGARDLIFLPFLAGERSPNWNPKMRACFIGLGLHHGKEEMIRSIMEGVMCRMRAIMELLRPSLPEKLKIRASGGYTRSKLWLEIQANLFNLPIEVPSETEAASLGAVMLAMFAQGKLTDLVNFEPQIKEKIFPEEDKTKKYHQIYQRHVNLYRLLEGYFTNL